MCAVSFGDSIRGLLDDGIPWAFLTAAVLVVLLTPLAARIAPRIGGVDHGGDRPRVHTNPVPRIGGVAIVIAILVAAALWVDIDGPYVGMLIGTGLVAILGLYDDIYGLRPSAKFLAVTLVALIPVLGWDLQIEHDLIDDRRPLDGRLECLRVGHRLGQRGDPNLDQGGVPSVRRDRTRGDAICSVDRQRRVRRKSDAGVER